VWCGGTYSAFHELRALCCSGNVAQPNHHRNRNRNRADQLAELAATASGESEEESCTRNKFLSSGWTAGLQEQWR